jgi:ribosomal-protein-alanine N-acetyltransferase
MQITLVKATTQDIKSYIELDSVAANTETYKPATYEEAMKELNENEVFFIKIGSHIIGRIAYQLKSSERAYISDLIIDPEFRKQGVARAALEKILEQLSDIKHINLVTNPGNTKAIALYESVGFVRGEVKPNYFGDGETLIEMTLR